MAFATQNQTGESTQIPQEPLSRVEPPVSTPALLCPIRNAAKAAVQPPAPLPKTFTTAEEPARGPRLLPRRAGGRSPSPPAPRWAGLGAPPHLPSVQGWGQAPFPQRMRLQGEP